jgi:hypothetical protein
MTAPAPIRGSEQYPRGVAGKLDGASGDVAEFKQAADRFITNMNARLAAVHGDAPEWKHGK